MKEKETHDIFTTMGAKQISLHDSDFITLKDRLRAASASFYFL